MVEWLIVILLVSLVVCVGGLVVVPFVSNWHLTRTWRRFEERNNGN